MRATASEIPTVRFIPAIDEAASSHRLPHRPGWLCLLKHSLTAMFVRVALSCHPQFPASPSERTPKKTPARPGTYPEAPLEETSFIGDTRRAMGVAGSCPLVTLPGSIPHPGISRAKRPGTASSTGAATAGRDNRRLRERTRALAGAVCLYRFILSAAGAISASSATIL